MFLPKKEARKADYKNFIIKMQDTRNMIYFRHEKNACTH